MKNGVCSGDKKKYVKILISYHIDGQHYYDKQLERGIMYLCLCLWVFIQILKVLAGTQTLLDDQVTEEKL